MQVKREYDVFNQKLKKFISYGIASGITKTITAPLNRFLILKKTPGTNQTTLLNMVRSTPFLQLWKGNSINCSRAFVHYGLSFFIYDEINNLLNRKNSQLSNTGSMTNKVISGTSAGIIPILITYPIDTLRNKRILGEEYGGNKSVLDMIRTTSLRNLYRGMIPHALAVVPYTAIKMSMFDVLFPYSSYISSNDTIRSFMCGCMSTAMGSVVCHPIELTRHQMQTGYLRKETIERNLFGQAKHIFTTKGILGFYRGYGAALMKVVPSSGIHFVLISYVRKYILEQR